MTWRVEISPLAERQLKKIDPQDARRLLVFLYERVEKRNDPRAIGEPLKGDDLGEFWKYRVGNFRIIAAIKDSIVTVFVVRLGHRRDVYR